MLRPPARLALCALLIAVAACDSRNNSLGPGQSNTDRSAPTVVSTVPSDLATDVAVTGPITVTFSEPMTAASITSAISFTPALPGTVSYSGNTATFTPTAPIAPGTNYTGTVATAARDLAGNNLGTAFTWSFSTTF